MSGIAILIFSATIFTAYANGANDNFKGVATLFGSGTTDYRKALSWATLATFSGSVAAFFFATRLVKTFTGKGLVPDALISNPAFLAAVALGAGLTVFFAVQLGIPLSTTHSLTGALAGAGFVALGTQLGWEALGKNFFTPLIVSPFVAIIFTVAIYFLMHHARKALGVTRKTCLVQSLLDFLHFLSAGAVSFARGLNDTPKIVALLVASGAGAMHTSPLQWPIVLVALAMAVGGILGARKVAETVSHKITSMNHGQGFSANLVTAILVIFASHWGMPVSTTHVSCGALFGLGLVNGRARWNVIASILGAWVLTLPVAAILSAASFFVMSRRGG